MSDLISRKAVEKAIKEYFKMIIDETGDDVDCVLDYNKNLCDTIDEIPVSYDVDKVVNQLENKMFSAELHGDDFNGVEINNLLCMGDVYEIVKRGGKDE